MSHLRSDIPRYSSDVWKDISQALNGKWAPNHVYHNVKYDRRNILTQARREMGLDHSKEEIEVDAREHIEETSSDSSDSHEDDGHARWFDLILTNDEWNAVKPKGKGKYFHSIYFLNEIKHTNIVTSTMRVF